MIILKFVLRCIDKNGRVAKAEFGLPVSFTTAGYSEKPMPDFRPAEIERIEIQLPFEPDPVKHGYFQPVETIHLKKPEPLPDCIKAVLEWNRQEIADARAEDESRSGHWDE